MRPTVSAQDSVWVPLDVWEEEFLDASWDQLPAWRNGDICRVQPPEVRQHSLSGAAQENPKHLQRRSFRYVADRQKDETTTKAFQTQPIRLLIGAERPLVAQLHQSIVFFPSSDITMRWPALNVGRPFRSRPSNRCKPATSGHIQADGNTRLNL